MPAVSEDTVCSIIEKLGSDKHRWSATSSPHGPKCNLFVDAVMHDSKIPRPWGEKGAPLCLDIQAQLANDSRFHAAWSTDYNNYAASYQNWAKFQLRPGDICLWNTNYVTHGAIAADGEHFSYAGAHEGFKQAPISYVCGTGHVENDAQQIFRLQKTPQSDPELSLLLALLFSHPLKAK